jgi:hypothetical protein
VSFLHDINGLNLLRTSGEGACRRTADNAAKMRPRSAGI